MSSNTDAVVPIGEIETVIESKVGDDGPAASAPAPKASAAAPEAEEACLDLTLSNWRDPKMRPQLKLELVAGITVSLAMVPEAVSFALMAKVSPMVGMQAAWIICLITSLFGGRPGVVCGATGAVAMLLPPVVEKFGVEGLFLCVMLAGVFQFALGLIGFGTFLIKMMPHPVMVGFGNGLAIIIGCAQIFDARPCGRRCWARIREATFFARISCSRLGKCRTVLCISISRVFNYF